MRSYLHRIVYTAQLLVLAISQLKLTENERRTVISSWLAWKLQREATVHLPRILYCSVDILPIKRAQGSSSKRVGARVSHDTAPCLHHAGRCPIRSKVTEIYDAPDIFQETELSF